MAEVITHSPEPRPSSAIPTKRALEHDHTPSVPSPPAPDATGRGKALRPPPRESREKKDSLKKREATVGTRGNTPDAGSKLKYSVLMSTSSPLRYGILDAKPSDYESPRDPIFMPHEPEPLFAQNSDVELRKPVDQSVFLVNHAQESS